MAAPASADELLGLIRKSKLVEARRLDDWLRDSHTPLPGDVQGLADGFVRDGLLTPFHIEQLMSGKWRGFELGKYRLLDRIGAGGMGQVFLAEHKIMRRRVALKVLPPKQAADPAARERFLREARAAGALTHPNIVRAYDVEEHASVIFLVMEFVEGVSLQQLVARGGPVSVERAGYYLWQAAIGLQHAHEAGLVHRDIKPGNLLIDRQGVIKLLDLGLARFFDDTDDNLTQRDSPKSVMGTADYLAPEQALNSHDVDIRADIYALGATAYFLLTGKPPFADANATQKLLAHQMREPKPLREIRPEIPAELAAIIVKMMKKLPDDRYRTPADLVTALDPYAVSPPAPPTLDEIPRLCPALAGPTSATAINSGTMLRPASSMGLRSAAAIPTSSLSQVFAPVSKGRMSKSVIAVWAGATLLAVAAGGAWLGGMFATPPEEKVALALPPPKEPAKKPASKPKPPSKSGPPARGVAEITVEKGGPTGSVATLAAAIAKARPGDTIIVKEPEITTAIRLDEVAPAGKDLTIISQTATGAKTVWKAPKDHAPGKPLLELQGTLNVRLRGFDFDGNNKVDDLVVLSGPSAASGFENCDFRRFARAGLRLQDTAGTANRPTRISNCRFHTPGKNAIAEMIVYATSGKQTVSLRVADCRFEGTAAALIAMNGGADDVDFTRCRFHDGGKSVVFTKLEKPSARRIAFTNNVFSKANAALHFDEPPVPTVDAVLMQNNVFVATNSLVNITGVAPLMVETEARTIWTEDAPDPAKYAPVGTRYFRKTFEVKASAPSEATLNIAADNEFEVWLNGKQVARNGDSATNHVINCYDVLADLKPGKNVIAVAATNTSPDLPNNAAGLACRLTLVADGKTSEIISDNSWKSATESAAGWESLGFNDATWRSARECSSPGESRLLTGIWLCELSKLGEIPSKVFQGAAGNVRDTTRSMFSPYVPVVASYKFKLPVDPSIDGEFLRIPADHQLAELKPQPGIPAQK